MNTDKVLQDIMDLGTQCGLTNSQFKKEVMGLVSMALHGKDISGMSRKDRVKVMTNSHECLDAYLKNEKKKVHQEDNPNW